MLVVDEGKATCVLEEVLGKPFLLSTQFGCGF